jgi:hypothetical protein
LPDSSWLLSITRQAFLDGPLQHAKLNPPGKRPLSH